MERNLNLSEQNLQTDLNLLSSEAINEFYIYCRKVGIYSIDHPLVRKAVSKPFMHFQKVFGFKKYFSMILTEGKFFVNNILLNDSTFVDFIKENMHGLEIESLLFADTLSADDLLIFSQRFVGKLPSSDPGYRMAGYLDNHKIGSILVNSDLGFKLFETGLRYRGDVNEDFSARRLVTNYFSGEIDLTIKVLSANYSGTEEQAKELGIDFHKELVNFLLPEKFAQLPPSELLNVASQIFADESGNVEASSDKLARLVRSFDFHPKREQLIDQIRRIFEERGISNELMQESFSGSGGLKLEAVQAIDQIVVSVFSKAFDPVLYARFHDAYMRLIRTRQMGKATAIAEVLVKYLAHDDPRYRQSSVQLLRMTIEAAIPVGEHEYLDIVSRQLQNVFTRGLETFEFSEVVIYLLESVLSLRCYETAARFLNILKTGRKVEAGVTTYDSLTVKRIFDDLDDHELIGRLVRELQIQNNEQIKQVRDILTAIQSEEVALQLSEIVTHPDRLIRQRCLKVLSELGQPAVKIFSEIIRDHENFCRPEGRHELPDKKWFFIRNTIFVLGNLGDPSACNAMRLRLSDPDVRVRTEIVRALEKIDDAEAADLMMIMAEDSDSIIREISIIALGQLRRKDLAPFFIDIVHRQRGEIHRIIGALALTGADEGRDFMIDLLNSGDKLKDLASGAASVDDIRRVIIVGLEKIGDELSVRKMEEFLNNHKNKDHFLIDNRLSKTAKLILGKIQPRK